MIRSLLLVALALPLLLACGPKQPKLPPSTWPVTVERSTPPSGDEWMELLGAPETDSSVRDAIKRTGRVKQDDVGGLGERSLWFGEPDVWLYFNAYPGHQPEGFPPDTRLLSRISLPDDYAGGHPRGIDVYDREGVARITGDRRVVTTYRSGGRLQYTENSAWLNGPDWMIRIVIRDGTTVEWTP
jgi:hypothetical protein